MNDSILAASPIALLLLGGVLSGCITDKELGDLDGETESSGSTAGETSTTQGPGGTSQSATSAAPTTTTLPSGTQSNDPATESTTTPGTDSAPDTESGPGETDTGDTEGGSICAGFTPPPIECGARGDARATFEGFLPVGEDQPCTAVVTGVEGTTETIDLDCGGEISTLIFDSDAPHMAWPLESPAAITLTAIDELEPAINGTPSFVIRDTEGDLVIASVNEIDLDPDVDVDPHVFTTSRSGCPGSSVAEKCDADGSILSQRITVEFGNDEAPLVLFDGNAGQQLANGTNYAITVHTAEDIVCWDDDCTGDDSGPFPALRVVIVRVE